MEYTVLGKSGLKVSVVGLGCGGPSRLGQATQKSERESIVLVRQALDMGINLVDTAEDYGTESIVGKAVKEVPRDQAIISTKKRPPAPGHRDPSGELKTGVEQSLRRLGTDYVDIYHLHGVKAEQYRYARDTLVPVVLRMREEGKIRSIGVTESLALDPGHRMLQQALEDDCWDVVMVGFNVLNPSARSRVLRRTLEKNIGVLVMCVGRLLSRPTRLNEIIAELKQKGLVDPGSCDSENPLGFLIQEGKVSTLTEAAYRYCRHEPGVDVVLTGTGNPGHLKTNVEAILKSPLPLTELQRLDEIFGEIDSVSGH